MKLDDNFYSTLNNIKIGFKSKMNPGIVLMFTALVALILANSPLKEWYFSLWNTEILFGTEHFNLFNHHGESFSLLQLVNDAIMAIFFFLVGIEIKREVMTGELSTYKKALLPIIAAIGGMAVPILMFYLTGIFQGSGPEEMSGIAIPMATDIAFSLGVLTLLGNRVPVSLKIFLMALAIVDDIGGILAIAIFYSHFTLASFIYLGIALLILGLLFLGNRMEIHSKTFYIVFGVAVWYLFLQAGIHPTIAGVLVAFTVPARPHINLKEFTRGIREELNFLDSKLPENCECMRLENSQLHRMVSIELKVSKAISPLQSFEEILHNWVNYFIMPLFAFANAGVVINIAELHVFEGVSLNILSGLLIGKMLGIFFFSWGSIKLKLTSLPKEMSLKSLASVSLLGGIGFTVALFLASLTYEAGSELLNQAKMGIILGSLLAGILGYLMLKKSLKDNYIE